jgi:AhpD family alkylhydroperoxidase
MYRNMVNTPAFLDTYLHGYNAFRNQNDFTSAEQEVVFLALSKSNGCDYCVAAHSTLAAKFSGVPAEILSAIRSDTDIPDKKIAALYAMAVELNDNRGRPSPIVVEDFLSAGYSEKDIMAIILALSVKILSNYSNHLFDTDVDEAFAEYTV